MALARYVVDAVVVEGRGVREVARAHGVSKTWVSVQLARYREGGYEALAPRSRRPHSRPNRTAVDIEDQIVRLRKDLVDHGFDAGASTSHWCRRGDLNPHALAGTSPSSWRVCLFRHSDG
jgi:transposase